MKIRWTTPASNDLEAIQEHLAKDDPKSAYQITQIIWMATQYLSKYPSMGRVGRVNSTRELVITHAPYIVAYRIKSNAIHVLAIYHETRKWPENF